MTDEDLEALGLQPGRHFKDLLDAVLERRVTDRDSALTLTRHLIGA